MEHISIIIGRRYPGWLADLPKERQEEAEQTDEHQMEALDTEKKRRSMDMTVVRKSRNEWMQSEEMKEFAKQARIRFYDGEIKRLTEELIENSRLYKENRMDESWLLPILANQAEQLEQRITRYRKGKQALMSKKQEEITPDMVDRAREHDIRSLVEVGPNGRAKCVFHQGEGWNMDIRKNFAHCYVCSASGDVIDVYRNLHGVGFREAVKALS